MVLLLFVGATIVLLIASYWSAIARLWERYQFAKQLDGPSIVDLIAATRKRKVLDFFQECRRKYGANFRFWLAFDLVVQVSDAEDIKTILTSNTLLHKARAYDVVRPWLGNGLLTNGGAAWHQKRKLLTPAFHFKILSSFKEPMEECVDILVGRLAKVADGETPVNIYSYITLFALDVICETAMGIKVNAQLNQESQFVKATQDICHILHHQLFSTWKRIPFLYQFTDDRKRRDIALKTIHGETRRVIALRRSLMDSDASVKEHDDGIGAKTRLAFLDSLLLAQRDSGLLTDDNIQEEVDTFMFEGHDTTSSAIAFAVLQLAQHPDVQRRAYEEVSKIDEVEVTQSIPYLEAVIKETERLYPSVPTFSRETTEPFQMGKLTVPAGVTVSVSTFLAHRCAKSFPEPNRFRPERFLEEESLQQMHPFANVPFSAGPRNCIGQRFAMLELKCSLRRLLREFEFLPVHGFVPNCVPEIILKSSNGIQVRLRKRTLS